MKQHQIHLYAAFQLAIPIFLFLLLLTIQALPCDPAQKRQKFTCRPSDCALCPFAACEYSPKRQKFACKCGNSSGKFCEICPENALFDAIFGCFVAENCGRGRFNVRKGRCECDNGYGGKGCAQCSRGFEMVDLEGRQEGWACFESVRCEIGFRKVISGNQLVCELNACENGVVWGDFCVVGN
ncbi:Cysteine-rich membrane protein 2 [Spironucleus salmonicida]|uniref:Cysteine-rich membrane protein 2 n=1 Tax=Spironucleus salmonicida TaxID=348837 RepID=V6LSW1_9EUKA|nr:Cysteine-rich membrane protein 2 [Spironucleus salmonicida]|eukprot:EST47732.1 Cysteine-rich membrane protein 2 [Spironucleus salmonicida]